jgi:hypothetical protein
MLSNIIASVDEYKLQYTNKQLLRAKEARKLYHAIGAPDAAKLKHFLKVNAIKNCPVLEKYVGIAERIFGKDISVFERKVDSTYPTGGTKGHSVIPPELLELHQKLELRIDIIYVNTIAILTSID